MFEVMSGGRASSRAAQALCKHGIPAPSERRQPQFWEGFSTKPVLETLVSIVYVPKPTSERTAVKDCRADFKDKVPQP